MNDILDSGYPLLQDFKDLCPGSYKHCQDVGIMVEAISRVLNLDLKKMKAAAWYHDIGKIKNPQYFAENQPLDVNLHDELEPFTSYNIIVRHVADSVYVLSHDDNFPLDVIRIIGQHHGDTVIVPFFYKAQQKNTEVSRDKFRYPYLKPDRLESVLLMICDKVDAMSKSLKAKNEFDAEFVIKSIFEDLEADGQLDKILIGDCRKN